MLVKNVHPDLRGSGLIGPGAELESDYSEVSALNPNWNINLYRNDDEAIPISRAQVRSR